MLLRNLTPKMEVKTKVVFRKQVLEGTYEEKDISWKCPNFGIQAGICKAYLARD